MRKREQPERPELAIRAVEKGLSDIADAYSVVVEALASISSVAGERAFGSKLTTTLAAHLIGAGAMAEKKLLAYGAALVPGDEQAGQQRLIGALRGFEIAIAEAATRPARGA